MSANGRMSRSELAPIANGMLRHDAARAFNALNAVARRRYGVTIIPAGSVSSYRTFAQQQRFYQLYRSGRGNLAAVPGTSNHGWGLAIDVATPRMAVLLDTIGARFGWHKRWSDAPSEWWHRKYKGGLWRPPAPVTKLRYGASGKPVRQLQKLLRAKNVDKAPLISGKFNSRTERAVKRYQKKHGLKADGVVGIQTWNKLRR